MSDKWYDEELEENSEIGIRARENSDYFIAVCPIRLPYCSRWDLNDQSQNHLDSYVLMKHAPYDDEGYRAQPKVIKPFETCEKAEKYAETLIAQERDGAQR